jgi:hypothetical protein
VTPELPGKPTLHDAAIFFKGAVEVCFVECETLEYISLRRCGHDVEREVEYILHPTTSLKISVSPVVSDVRDAHQINLFNDWLC